MPKDFTKIVADVLRRHPRERHLDALCAAGEKAAIEEDLDVALALYDHAIRLDASSARAWAGRARILHERGRRNEAMGCLDRALESDPRFVPALLAKGDLLLELKDAAGALAAFQAAVAAGPDVVSAWIRRSCALEELGRDADALGSLEGALEGPDAALVWARRGELLGKLGRLEEAARAYERAVKLDPDVGDSWYGLARAKHATKRMEDAKRALQQFLSIADPGDRRVGAARALLGEMSKDVLAKRLGTFFEEEARSGMRKRVRLTPTSTVPPRAARRASSQPALAAYASGDGQRPIVVDLEEPRSLHRAGRNEEALAAIDEIVKVAHQSADAWVLRAQILLALSRLYVALGTAERATRANPKSTDAWRLTARCRLEANDADGALSAADRVLSLAPNDAEGHRLRGRSLLVLRRPREAVEAFARCVQHAPDDPSGWLLLGRVHRELGRTSDAREALKNAIALAGRLGPSFEPLAAEARDLLSRTT